MNVHLVCSFACLLAESRSNLLHALARSFVALSMQFGEPPAGAQKRRWSEVKDKAARPKSLTCQVNSILSRIRRMKTEQPDIYRALRCVPGQEDHEARRLLVEANQELRHSIRTPDALALADLMLVMVKMSTLLFGGAMEDYASYPGREGYTGAYESKLHAKQIANDALLILKGYNEAVLFLKGAETESDEVEKAADATLSTASTLDSEQASAVGLIASMHSVMVGQTGRLFEM